MTATEILHPDYRPRRGERRSDRGITLYGDAAGAFRTWEVIYENRCAAATGRDPGRDAYARLDLNRIADAIAVGDKLGQLLSIAVTDAETRPTTDRAYPTVNSPQAYEVAQALAAHADTFRAPPVSAPQDDTCRHGVPFAADCPDCEA